MKRIITSNTGAGVFPGGGDHVVTGTSRATGRTDRVTGSIIRPTRVHLHVRIIHSRVKAEERIARLRP